MKTSRKVLLGMIVLILAGIYYYVALPAINIPLVGRLVFCAVPSCCACSCLCSKKTVGKRTELKQSES